MRKMTKPFFLFVLGWIFILLSGCNLPLAHGFADSMMPEDLTGRLVSAPITVPVYTTLAALDVTLVNPIVACINLPDEIARAWNEGSDDPNQAKVITLKILVAPLYTVYLLGFIVFSEQFVDEDEVHHNSGFSKKPP